MADIAVRVRMEVYGDFIVIEIGTAMTAYHIGDLFGLDLLDG